MAGNIAEWVADVYRPIIDEDANDFNYYRGNQYKQAVIDENGKTSKIISNDGVVYKTLLNGKRVAVALPGEIAKVLVDESDTRFRTNYSESYNINFRDGDKRSSRSFLDQEEFTDSITGSNPDETRSMYNSPNLRAVNDMDEFMYDDSDKRTSLINDQARVYKGGSWKDRAYWLDPAQRRFYPEDNFTNFIGFRCAMSRVGSRTVTEQKKEIKKILFL